MGRNWNQPILMTTTNPEGEKEIMNFPPLGFRPIGLRVYTPDNCSRELKRYVHCMQKSLFGRQDWFYFSKGFTIKGSPSQGFHAEVSAEAFDASFNIFRGTRDLVKHRHERGNGKSRLENLNINAVVGQNGSGKSSMVDMIVRIINNLSAAIYGEHFIYNSAQHLHYIENVYASLAVYIDDCIQILTVWGHDIYLETLARDLSEYTDDALPETQRYTPARLPQHILSSNDHAPSDVLNGHKAFESILKNWFYTIVSNYSLYAYNFNDYIFEETPTEKIDALRPEMDDIPGKEDYYWLKGVFHKNDGYQTPLVVNPMRQNGYINAKRENELGLQNLIMLSFMKVEYKDRMGITEYSDFTYRNINDTHRVVSLFHTWTEGDKYEGFENTYHDGKKIHEPQDQAKYDSLNRAYKYVKDYWAKRIGVCCVIEDCKELFKTNTMKEQAWDYVVYKTYRILEHYKKYQKDYKFFTEDFDKEKITEHLDKLVRDFTHCTRKLRRTLAFIKLYDEHPSTCPSRVDVDDYYDWMNKHLGEPLYVGEFKDAHSLEIEDLLPPPCCRKVQIGLVELSHIDEYHKDKAKFLDVVPFEGLSSGERQIAYTIGNLLYHAINIDSTVEDINATEEQLETKHYRHLNVLMDEVELYFHPDLQRKFVKLLVDALNNSTWSQIASINITLVTHSPFVLSDIPACNVLCLSRGKVENVYDRTFAANIHDLLNNTFILPDTIGDLAKHHIIDFVIIYNEQVEWWRKQDEAKTERTPDNSVYNQYVLNRDRFEYVCRIVGDDYLREELADMMDELDKFYKSKGMAL